MRRQLSLDPLSESIAFGISLFGSCIKPLPKVALSRTGGIYWEKLTLFKLTSFSPICKAQLRKSAQWSVIILQITVFFHGSHASYAFIARKTCKNQKGSRQAMLCSSFYGLVQYYVLQHHAKHKNAVKSRRQTTHALFNLFYKRVYTGLYVLRKTYMQTKWTKSN